MVLRKELSRRDLLKVGGLVPLVGLASTKLANGGIIGDLNGDGKVDLRDLAVMGQNWMMVKYEVPREAIPVSSPMELKQSNAYYILKNDLTNLSESGFVMKGLRNVIFDLGGNTISGLNNYMTAGIFVEDCENVQVVNGGVQGFRYGSIVFQRTKKSAIADIDARVGTNGILIRDHSNENLLRRVTVNSTDNGIFVEYNSDRNQIIESTLGLNFGNWYGLKVSKSSNIGVIDSRIENSLLGDVYFENNSINNVLLDTSSDILKELVADGSELIKGVSYKARVWGPSGNPMANAQVVLRSIEGNLEAALKTDADGKTPKIWVTSYIHQGNHVVYNAPFTITATKDNKSATHVYDPNGFNSEDSFVLE